MSSILLEMRGKTVSWSKCSTVFMIVEPTQEHAFLLRFHKKTCINTWNHNQPMAEEFTNSKWSDGLDWAVQQER